MDLTKAFPRSPRMKMGGLVMLPRMIDKARAFNSNTLGEYIFPCPLDKIILEFMNINQEEIIQLLRKLNDKELSLWVNNRCLNFSLRDKEKINQKILKKRPDNQESLSRFNELRNKIDRNRTEIVTWVDLLDLDENRI